MRFPRSMMMIDHDCFDDDDDGNKGAVCVSKIYNL